MRHCANCCAYRSNRYRDIVIFKLLGCRLHQPSWISLDLKFVTDQTVTRAELRHRAKFSLKSLKLWLRYDEFSIFQNGGRHVGFLKLHISNCGTHRKCRIASPCQISWRSVKPLSRYLYFVLFKMAAATILDF